MSTAPPASVPSVRRLARSSRHRAVHRHGGVVVGSGPRRGPGHRRSPVPCRGPGRPARRSRTRGRSSRRGLPRHARTASRSSTPRSTSRRKPSARPRAVSTAAEAEASTFLVSAYMDAGSARGSPPCRRRDINTSLNQKVLLESLHGDREQLTDDLSASRADLDDRNAELEAQQADVAAAEASNGPPRSGWMPPSPAARSCTTTPTASCRPHSRRSVSAGRPRQPAAPPRRPRSEKPPRRRLQLRRGHNARPAMQPLLQTLELHRRRPPRRRLHPAVTARAPVAAAHRLRHPLRPRLLLRAVALPGPSRPRRARSASCTATAGRRLPDSTARG